jgi:hypothetical protein
MSEASDIADLLAKATHDVARQRRLGWVKGLVFCLAAFAGAGWTAHGYLSQLATKADITSLEAQYSAVRESERAHEQRQDERLHDLEPQCASAVQCCLKQSERLDRYTTPRAFGR